MRYFYVYRQKPAKANVIKRSLKIVKHLYKLYNIKTINRWISKKSKFK